MKTSGLQEQLRCIGQPVRLTRRGFVQAGALGVVGLTLPDLLRAETGRERSVRIAGASRPKPPPVAKARSCILFFMEGGPSHIDLWDMKPRAPAHVRGPFRPVATSLPGLQVCEHLPRLARVAHRLSVLRAVSHTIVDHNAGSYYILTGHYPLRDSQLIRGPSSENFPPYGSVLARLRPSGEPLPDYVHVPRRMFNCGDFIPGVLAGFLGDAYDPLIAGDPSRPGYKVPGLEQRASLETIDRRKRLLKELDSLAAMGDDPALDRLETFYQKAFALISHPKARRAFRIDDEPESVRRRYGLPQPVAGVPGGGMPHLGHSMLLARRLVEAGVRLVSVWAGGQAFDGHREHFSRLERGLCPPTDQALSALVEDLADRGLLDETLVVALSEFGRTPKIGQVTSSAGAAEDGRDHWPHAYTVLLAGAGLKPGTIFGATDRDAAYPTENAVTPEDVAATIYTLMGIDPETRLYDRLNRPHTLAAGRAIRELFA